MTINQIINWIMGVNNLIQGAAGFFIVIGILLLVTAIYSLIYDKAFRKKYLLKLGTIFFILLGSVIGIIYLLMKYGALIL